MERVADEDVLGRHHKGEVLAPLLAHLAPLLAHLAVRRRVVPAVEAEHDAVVGGGAGLGGPHPAELGALFALFLGHLGRLLQDEQVGKVRDGVLERLVALVGARGRRQGDGVAAQPLHERVPRVAVNEDGVQLVALVVPLAVDGYLGRRPDRLVPDLLVPAVLQQAQAAHDAVDHVHHAATVGKHHVVLHQRRGADLQALPAALAQQCDVVRLLADGRDAACRQQLVRAELAHSQVHAHELSELLRISRPLRAKPRNRIVGRRKYGERRHTVVNEVAEVGLSDHIGETPQPEVGGPLVERECRPTSYRRVVRGHLSGAVRIVQSRGGSS